MQCYNLQIKPTVQKGQLEIVEIAHTKVSDS